MFLLRSQPRLPGALRALRGPEPSAGPVTVLPPCGQEDKTLRISVHFTQTTVAICLKHPHPGERSWSVCLAHRDSRRADAPLLRVAPENPGETPPPGPWVSPRSAFSVAPSICISFLSASVVEPRNAAAPVRAQPNAQHAQEHHWDPLENVTGAEDILNL